MNKVIWFLVILFNLIFIPVQLGHTSETQFHTELTVSISPTQAPEKSLSEKAAVELKGATQGVNKDAILDSNNNQNVASGMEFITKAKPHCSDTNQCVYVRPSPRKVN